MADSDVAALLRTVVVYVHLLACCAAFAAIAVGDIALFMERGVNRDLLVRASQAVTLALAGLWATGLGIIWIDTGFDVLALTANGKLLAKLTVVVILTLNGAALHRLVFPRFAVPQRDPIAASALPALLGAISLATWLFAAFVGVAKPLAAFVGYWGFIAAYAAMLAGAISVALTFVRPRLAARLATAPLDAGARTPLDDGVMASGVVAAR